MAKLSSSLLIKETKGSKITKQNLRIQGLFLLVLYLIIFKILPPEVLKSIDDGKLFSSGGKRLGLDILQRLSAGPFRSNSLLCKVVFEPTCSGNCSWVVLLRDRGAWLLLVIKGFIGSKREINFFSLPDDFCLVKTLQFLKLS